MALEEELETFARELPHLLARPEAAGKYALVKGSRLICLCDTLEEGLAAGYALWLFEPFLVKKVSWTDAPAYCSRRVMGGTGLDFGVVAEDGRCAHAPLKLSGLSVDARDVDAVLVRLGQSRRGR